MFLELLKSAFQKAPQLILNLLKNDEFLLSGKYLNFLPDLYFSFLHRIINHPVLVKDADVHEFLELESELPRANAGQGISGASAMKLLKNVGEAVGKLTFRMDESDEVFVRFSPITKSQISTSTLKTRSWKTGKFKEADSLLRSRIW